MDVGGTLTKIVYFEAKLANSSSMKSSTSVTSASTNNLIEDFNIFSNTNEVTTTQTLNDKSSSNMNQNTNSLVGGIKRSNSLHKLDDPEHQRALHQLYGDMNKIGTSLANTSLGTDILTRDEKLAFYSTLLEGKLHFLHFETRNMATAINILSSTAITENIRSIGI